MARRFMTIMLVPDDEASMRRYRLPFWLYRTVLVVAVLIVLAPVIYIISHMEVLALAADAGRLREENATLKQYQAKIVVLEQSLAETRHLMTQVARLAGLDSTLLADMYGQPAITPTADPRPSRTANRINAPTLAIPHGLPVAGWISRGYSDDPSLWHTGLDLAVPEGTPVVSTAAGIVSFAGIDSIYGQMAVVQNNDSIETVYGHNSTLLVQVGDTIFAGQRIALSGNTGKSSAPHLHYEIRINRHAVNPAVFLVHDKQNP